MKKLFILLIISLSFFSNCQTDTDKIEVDISSRYPVIAGHYKNYIVIDNKYIISVKGDDKVISIQKFNLKENKEVSFNRYKDFNKNVKGIDLIFLDKHLYYIYEEFDKKNKQTKVNAREIDIENASFKGEFELLRTGEIEAMPQNLDPYFKAKELLATHFTNFEVEFSSDKSKILIRYKNKVKKDRLGNSYDYYGFVVLNRSLNVLWNKELKMSQLQNEITYSTSTISNKGVVYLLSSKKENDNFEFSSVSAKGIKINKFSLDQKINPYNLLIKEGVNSSIIVAGFGVKHNLIILNLDEGGDFLSLKSIDGFQENMYIHSLTMSDSGNIFIEVESEYYEYTYSGSGTASSYIIHNKGDYFMLKLNSSGEEIWQKQIQKNNRVFYSEIGYQSFETSEYQVIFTIRVVKYYVGDKKRFKKLLFVSIIDRETGQKKRQRVLDLYNVNGIKVGHFKLRKILIVNENEFVFEVYMKNKEDAMIRFQLD